MPLTIVELRERIKESEQSLEGDVDRMMEVENFQGFRSAGENMGLTGSELVDHVKEQVEWELRCYQMQLDRKGKKVEDIVIVDIMPSELKAQGEVEIIGRDNHWEEMLQKELDMESMMVEDTERAELRGREKRREFLKTLGENWGLSGKELEQHIKEGQETPKETRQRFKDEKKAERNEIKRVRKEKERLEQLKLDEDNEIELEKLVLERLVVERSKIEEESEVELEKLKVERLRLDTIKLESEVELEKLRVEKIKIDKDGKVKLELEKIKLNKDGEVKLELEKIKLENDRLEKEKDRQLKLKLHKIEVTTGREIKNRTEVSAVALHTLEDDKMIAEKLGEVKSAREFRLPYFENKMASYLYRLEMYVNMNDWPRDRGALKLDTILKDKAL